MAKVFCSEAFMNQANNFLKNLAKIPGAVNKFPILLVEGKSRLWILRVGKKFPVESTEVKEET